MEPRRGLLIDIPGGTEEDERVLPEEFMPSYLIGFGADGQDHAIRLYEKFETSHRAAWLVRVQYKFRNDQVLTSWGVAFEDPPFSVLDLTTGYDIDRISDTDLQKFDLFRTSPNAQAAYPRIRFTPPAFFPKYIIAYATRGAAETMFGSLSQRIDAEGEPLPLWLIRYQKRMSMAGTRSLLHERHHDERAPGGTQSYLGDVRFGVGLQNHDIADQWIHEHSDEIGGDDGEGFHTFEVLDATLNAVEKYPVVTHVDHRAPSQVLRQPVLSRFYYPDEYERWLINQGYTPVVEDGVTVYRHPDERPTPPRRRARRMPSRPFVYHVIPHPGHIRKMKVAFTASEMATFGYGGLARGGRDYIQRGRNDRLERNISSSAFRTEINVDYFLFRNLIATLTLPHGLIAPDELSGVLVLSDAGYKTKTTKDRLNTLLDSAGVPFFIVQSAWDWYLVPRETGWSTSRENWEDWDDRQKFTVRFAHV